MSRKSLVMLGIQESSVTVVSRRIAAFMAAMMLVVAFGGTVALAPVSAQSGPVQAYVWADDPTAESYTPNQSFQHNSTGEVNTITRTGTGAYTVAIPGIGNGLGSLHLTAASGSAQGSEYVAGTTCKIDRSSANSEQYVVCFNAAGEPADSAFYLSYSAGDVDLGAHAAYLWANDPTADSYTPDERYQFNSTNNPNTVRRGGAGMYAVFLPGMAAHQGNVQVTPASGSTLGEISGVSCGVFAMGDAGDDARGVNVLCSDSSGSPVDTGFTLRYIVGVKDASSEAGIWARGGYAMVNHSGVSNRYTAGANFQFNSTGATNEIQRTDVGQYAIYLMNVGTEGGNVQVSAWGTEHASATCNVAYWDLEEGSDGLNFIVHAACYDVNGNPIDSFLHVSYVMPEE